MKLLTTCIGFVAVFISACSIHTKQTSSLSTLTGKTLSTDAELHGKRGQMLPNQKWLVSSESRGLLLLDEQGKTLNRFPGNFETLAVRHNVQLDDTLNSLIASVDNEQGDIKLISLSSQGEFTLEYSFVFTEAQVEAVCLFRKPQGHISLFAADTLGEVHQYIVYDNDTKQVISKKVRSFIGVPEVQACSVDDQRELLYLAEGNVGVWQYNANAESDPMRNAVALSSPFGELEGEITDVHVSEDGSIWITTPESKQIHLVQLINNRRQSFSIASLQTPETASVSWYQGQFFGLVFDDNTDSYSQITFQEVFSEHSLRAEAPIQLTTMSSIYASAETTPVARFGDAADDPAIWIDQQNPANSLIFGTDKRMGLMVYALNGDLLQSLELGRMNNVDVRQDPSINNSSNTIIAASNRTDNSISLFDLDPQQQVRHLGNIPTDLPEVYGLCMYQSATGSYVFINDKDGRYQQYLVSIEDTDITATKVREFTLPSQPEGCSADDQNSLIYMGEEDNGIWLADAEPSAQTDAKLIINVGEILKDDVEGMEIYHGENVNYLMVSSQGNDSFIVYGLWDDYPVLTNFMIDMNLRNAIDGVSETDGLTVTSTALPGFPMGVLIVQDGRNRMPEQPQNFKVIDWRQVQALIGQASHEQNIMKDTQ
jgi:3-phytase